MDHQFKEDRKTVPTLKNSSIYPRKIISHTYLLYRLFARGRATSKHGEEVGMMQFLEFKRGANKKFYEKEKKEKKEKK
jgi:hypothetical protein